MAVLRAHVHGMDCAEEAALVRRALASSKAVRQLDFDVIHGIVDITYDEQLGDEHQLLRAIRSTGLTAHAVHGVEGERAVEREHAAHEHGLPRASTISTGISGVLFLVGWIIEGLTAEHWLEVFVHAEHAAHNRWATAAYGGSALVGLWPMWPRAAAAVRHVRFDMHALVCLTVVGAVAIGEVSEGAAVAFLFALAHQLETWSLDRARREIRALVGRGPSLVAERMHPAVPMERWIERFAAVYTPLVVGAAILVAIVPPLMDGEWSAWFYRALVFLVLACPCALVISTPVTTVAALSAAAGRGVLVKGGAVLERAARASAPTREALQEAGVTVAGAQAHVDRLASADVVLATTSEQAIGVLVRHARRAMAVIRQNVAIALLTKGAFLVSAALGTAPLWLAVLADTGATVIVTINGLRLLRAGE